MGREESSTRDNEMGVEGAKEQKATSNMVPWKDPIFRNKLLRWLCLPLGNLILGVVDSQGGPTIRDVQTITSTNKETASFFFTAYNLGYLLGSFLGGWCYGKINSHLIMMVACILAGVANIASPYCSTFVFMFLIRTLVGMFLGLFLCTSNTEHMLVWGTKGEALFQFLNFVYAIGGVLGPLIAKPFIAEKETANKTLSQTENISLSETGNKTYWSVNVTMSPFFNSASNSTLIQTSNVHYSFLIGGGLLILSAIPCLVSFLMHKTSTNKSEEEVREEVVDRKLPLKVKVIILGTIFLFYFFYVCVEIVFSSYIMTFVVDEYEEVTTEQGDYITTFFWASFAAARGAAIFTSKNVAASKLLCLHLTLVTIALSGFLVSALYSRIDILTAFTCVLGVACSAIYSAGYSWVEAEIMTVSGLVSALLLIGSSLGAVIIPFVVGYLMENVSNFWFCYSLIIALALAVFFFVFLLCFNRFYVNKKYGKVRQEVGTENQNGVPEIRAESRL